MLVVFPFYHSCPFFFSSGCRRFQIADLVPTACWKLFLLFHHRKHKQPIKNLTLLSMTERLKMMPLSFRLVVFPGFSSRTLSLHWPLGSEQTSTIPPLFFKHSLIPCSIPLERSCSSCCDAPPEAPDVHVTSAPPQESRDLCVCVCVFVLSSWSFLLFPVSVQHVCLWPQNNLFILD